MCNREGVDLSNLARRIASAFGKRLASGVDDELFYTQESVFGVAESVSRLQAALKKMGVPVFATFDHGKNAEEVGMSMPPAVVTVFGAPSVGTKLMQANPAICLELPLKIAVWEDAQGSVWVTAPRIDLVAGAIRWQSHPIVPNMQKLLEKLVGIAANLY